MNILDIILLVVFLMFIIVGMKQGVIKELVSFVGTIIIFIISYSLKGILGNYLCSALPFVKFYGSLEGIDTVNIFMYQAIAFVVVFAILLGVYMLIVKISSVLQKIVNYTFVLLIPSQILGGIIGLIKGWIIAFVVFVFLAIPMQDVKLFKESKLANRILYKTPVLSKNTTTLIKPLKDIYHLGSDISLEKITKDEANLKSIDIILKYKVTDKKTVEKLIKDKKIKKVNGVDEILSKYDD